MDTTDRAGRAPLLREGDHGPQVRAVRERLTATGDLPGSAATGDAFGADVERAVRSFQQRRGMLVDGVVGAQTYVALDGARWLLGDRILMHSAVHLVTGDDVAGLQQRLLDLGFRSGRVDGIFGRDTDAALRDLQRGVGLRPDGLAGPYTLRALQRLSRAVSGGAPLALRETERIRHAGPGLRGRVIVLDPGHDVRAPGAQRGSLREGEIVLDLTHRLAARLTAAGVDVALTREPSSCPTQLERVQVANTLDADLLLSLHCESVPNAPRASGVASFFYGGQTGNGAWSAGGERLASLIQQEVVTRTGLVDCRHHPRTWDVLRLSRMPAARVEVGHLSHPQDAQRLADPDFREVVADALLSAVRQVYQDDAAGPATSRPAHGPESTG